MSATIPKTIGRYQIVCEVGRGAMGVVYKATDPNIGRTVALKTMRIDVHGDDEEEFLRRFKHEAKLAGVMSHPNIVTVHDAGEDEGVFFMAMEYLEGVTLHSVLKQNRLIRLPRVIEISEQVGAGLDYAHAHGVIHRDVKPANIMCVQGGHVKIMDFGIAKSGAGMTTAGQVLGTPTYMSPEQVRGKMLDGRSDLFSFGVILYEMVTGEKPFTGQNVTTIIYKIMNEEPAPPRDVDASVPAPVSAIILKALAKNPNERYQNAAELIRDLHSCKSAESESEAVLMAVASAGASGSNPPPPEHLSPTITSFETSSSTEITQSVRSEPQTTTKMLGSSGPSVETVETTSPNNPDAVLQEIGSTVMVGDHMKLHDPKPRTPAEKLPVKKIGIAAAALLLLAAVVVGRQIKRTAGAEQTTSAPPAATIQQQIASGPITTASSKPSPAKPAASSVKPKPSGPAVKTGAISLRSTPPGAAITLDKKETGKVTPATLKVESGRHEITLHREFYRDANVVANVKAGEAFNFAPVMEQEKTGSGNPFHAIKGIFGGKKIPPGKGMAQIKSRPSGAEVTYKGSEPDQHTPLKVPLDPGTYRVKVKLDGYRPQEKEFTVVQGKSVDVNVELQPK